MSRSVVSSFKHKAQPSVLGLDTTRIANFLNYMYLKNFTVYVSILTLIFSIQVFLAKKISQFAESVS